MKNDEKNQIYGTTSFPSASMQEERKRLQRKPNGLAIQMAYPKWNLEKQG